MKRVFALIVLCVLAYVAYPGARDAFRNAKKTAAAANVKLFSDAVEKAHSSGQRGAGTEGFSKKAALQWYLDTGLISGSREPDMSRLVFRQGIWSAADTPQTEKDLYTLLAAQFVVDWKTFLQAQGFSSPEDAVATFGNLDDWARKNGYFSFNALVYDNYGGSILHLTGTNADAVVDSAVTMPVAAFEVLTAYPQLLADADLAALSMLIEQALEGKYGSMYPTPMAQDCLGRIVVEASTRPGDVWKDIVLKHLDAARLDLTGAVLIKTNLDVKQINQATSYEEADFSGMELLGFDPSGRSLRNAIMPEDASSPRLFRWSTGVRPQPGTVWVDGKRPWG